MADVYVKTEQDITNKSLSLKLNIQLNCAKINLIFYIF